jgi:hypothetical protein
MSLPADIGSKSSEAHASALVRATSDTAPAPKIRLCAGAALVHEAARWKSKRRSRYPEHDKREPQRAADADPPRVAAAFTSRSVEANVHQCP